LGGSAADITGHNPRYLLPRFSLLCEVSHSTTAPSVFLSSRRITTVASTTSSFANVTGFISTLRTTCALQHIPLTSLASRLSGAPSRIYSLRCSLPSSYSTYESKHFSTVRHGGLTPLGKPYGIELPWSCSWRRPTKNGGAVIYQKTDRGVTFSTTQHNLTEAKMPPTGAARAKFYFQIVSTPTSDTPGTTILLHFDNKRYLFGSIAEGTQRVCVQRGIRLKQVRDIFITGQAKWRDIGGLLGMILTMADVQKLEGTSDESLEQPKLGIHGAPLLTHAIACGRRFIFRT
jgi:hypothetical protein